MFIEPGVDFVLIKRSLVLWLLYFVWGILIVLAMKELTPNDNI